MPDRRHLAKPHPSSRPVGDSDVIFLPPPLPRLFDRVADSNSDSQCRLPAMEDGG